MAPLRTLPSANVAPRKSILKKSSEPKRLQSESLFPTSKQDKRRIKHAQLLSKVAKSATFKTKKRRCNKQLVATLDALGDALPDVDDDGAAGTNPSDQVNIIKRKSMKSKPGAMKRREALDKTERDRFAKNLAQMTQEGENTTLTASEPASKFRILRAFIANTMEKKAEVSATRT